MTRMTDLPPYLQPFVLDVAQGAEHRVDRVGELDFHRPAGTARTGAILLIHGGPGPADLEVSPRDWPVYQGYAAAIALRGQVAVVVDHSLIRGLDQLTTAADDVEAAVGVLRADPQVDPDRVVLWFFSGAGLLAGEWLDSRPDWLRAVALTYPLLATPPGVDELVSAAEVIGKHSDLPVLLTRVGREREELARPVAEFVSAGGAALDIIDVPKGQHGFDMLDHSEESRAAVTKALDWAIAHLGEDPTAPTQLPIPATTIPAPQPTKTAATATRATTPRGEAAAQPRSAAGGAVAPGRSAVGGPAAPGAVRAASAPSGLVPAPSPRADAVTEQRDDAAPATSASAAPAEAAAVSAGSAAGGAAVGVAEQAAGPVSQQSASATTTDAAASTSAPAAAASAPAVVVEETVASRVVGREHAAFEAHDLEAFLATYSPTALLQFADGPVMRGRRSLREHYRPQFEAGECKRELVQRMLVGDWVVEQTITDQVPTVALYQVQDGLITEVRFIS
ncbi:nuclear transport factor 2 family protein [Kribbella sp. NPDC051718]|uniref:nuclear transport factor 2 family protein n=1 Tax=Kribbella sp. NPDC051718 TaxID=3155168 RepID=UPI00341F78DF